MMTELLNCYQQYTDKDAAFAPSGADLIAQIQGGITYFNKATDQYSVFTWPFKHMGFYLLRTGKKIATHEHLQTLQPFPYQALQDCCTQAMAAWQQSNAENFAKYINHYGELLQAQHFVHPRTQTLLTHIKQQAGILAAKGCGALGADIVLALVAINKKDAFSSWAKQQALTIIADETALSNGLQINEQ